MRGRNRLLGALALAALAGAVALAVVLAGGRSSGSGQRSGADTRPAVRAQASVSPTAFLFGDTVRARVQVLVDRRRVDPRDVKVDARFSPYSLVAGPTRDVRSAGPVTLVTYTVALRCLGVACVARVVPLHLQF